MWRAGVCQRQQADERCCLQPGPAFFAAPFACRQVQDAAHDGQREVDGLVRHRPQLELPLVEADLAHGGLACLDEGLQGAIVHLVQPQMPEEGHDGLEVVDVRFDAGLVFEVHQVARGRVLEEPDLVRLGEGAESKVYLATPIPAISAS